MTDPATAAAIAGAYTHVLTANTRDGGPNPDGAVRDALRRLSQIAPGAGVADAALAVTSRPVVALDPDTLRPSSDPLTTYEQILQHYSDRWADGCGLPLGAQRDGSVLVAVRCTAASWVAWLAAHGVERREVDDDYGTTRTVVSYMDPGPHVRVHWAPAPMAARSTPVVVGQAALIEEGDKVRADRAGVGEIGWVAWAIGSAWAIGAQPGKRLEFSTKKLDLGVEVLAAGEVLPLHAARRDGWTLTSTGLPATIDPPEWLVTALGGRWVRA